MVAEIGANYLWETLPICGKSTKTVIIEIGEEDLLKQKTEITFFRVNEFLILKISSLCLHARLYFLLPKTLS